MSEEQVVVPKRRGRPPKVKTAAVEREPMREPKHVDKWDLSNWSEFTPSDETSPDRLRIPKEDWPEGFALLWALDSTYGRPESQFRMRREREGGWKPVHQEDFDKRYDGRFMRRGEYGKEINVDGLVLMARPIEIQNRALKRDLREAREQVAIKEMALGRGDMPNVSLDAQHPSAVRTNRISKSYERLDIPKD